MWQLRVYAGKDPITGKDVYVSGTAYGGKRQAEVALAELVAETQLRRHRVALEERAAACEVRLVPDPFVFTDAADGSVAWRPDRVSHAWERTRSRVGMDDVRLHDLRHFQATMLLQAGVAVSNISKRIGHRDTATTLNVYAQFLESTDREAASIIGNLLPGAPTTPTPSESDDEAES